MANQDPEPDFSVVEPDSFVSYPCSPHSTNPTYTGIMLAAPRRATFRPGAEDPLTGAWGEVVVCGYCRFRHDYLDLDGDFLESIVLVATDVATHATWSGHMTVVPNRVAEPLPPGLGLTPDDFADRLVGQFFNPNLVTVLGLPPRAATYRVHATLGDARSEVVTIRVEQDG